MNKEFHLGQALRDLRQQRRLSGEELGKKAGLSQSKISRIETGVSVNIDPNEVEKILHILEAPQLIRQQVMAALGEPKSTGPRRFKLRFPYSTPTSYERVRQATFIRHVSVGPIPAIMQIPEFRQIVLKHTELTPEQLQVQLRQTIQRQDLLWDMRRRFHFILHESVLYTMLAGKAVQRAQLDRIERLIGFHNIKLGIIPLEAGWPPDEVCSFIIFDTRYVRRAIADGDLESNDDDDIAIYLNLFNMLDKSADYGDAARALIHKAIDYFS